MWRLLAKALGEKATECDIESDKVAFIRLSIVAIYIVTNVAIISGIIHHW
jgi:hypothetical protein